MKSINGKLLLNSLIDIIKRIYKYKYIDVLILVIEIYSHLQIYTLDGIQTNLMLLLLFSTTFKFLCIFFSPSIFKIFNKLFQISIQSSGKRFQYLQMTTFISQLVLKCILKMNLDFKIQIEVEIFFFYFFFKPQKRSQGSLKNLNLNLNYLDINYVLLGIQIIIEMITSQSFTSLIFKILETLIILLITKYLIQKSNQGNLCKEFLQFFEAFPFPSVSCNKKLEVVGKNTQFKLKECNPKFPSFTNLQTFFGSNGMLIISKEDQYILEGFFKKSSIFLSYYQQTPVKFNFLNQVNHINQINTLNILSLQECKKAISSLFQLSKGNNLYVFIIFLPKMDYFDSYYKSIQIQNFLLLRSISHELRTPINGILGSLLLIKDEIPQRVLFSYLIAEKSSHLFLNFVNTMIDYTSIKFGCFKLNQTTFGASEFAKDIYQLFQEKAKISKLDFYISEKLLGKCLIHSDYARLREVIIYLLQNSFEHTHKGYVVLEMANDQKRQIKFSIIDSGYGITNTEIRLINSKSIMNISEDETGLSSKRYGLGYKAANLILSKLDSTLIIRSVVGVGTTASFSIRDLILADKEDRTAKELFTFSKKQKNTRKRSSFTSKKDIPKNFQVQLDHLNIPKALKYFEKMNSVRINHQFLNDKRNNSTSYEKLFTEEVPPEDELHPSEVEKNSINLSIKTHTFFATKTICQAQLDKKKERLKGCTTSNNLKDQFRKQSSITKFNNSINIIKHTILIVDDEPFNRFTLSSMILKHPDLEVKEAPNGKVAIEMVETFLSSIKLIFMDINMPILDGYEATRIIKKNLVIKKVKIPIIALTSYSSDTEKAKSFEAGMDDFCNKPLKVEKLNEYLEKYIYLKQENLV